MKATGIIIEGTKSQSIRIKFSDMQGLEDVSIPLDRESLLNLKTTVDDLCDVVFKCQLKPKSIVEVLKERITNWNTLDETSAKERLLQIDMLLKSFGGNKKEKTKDPIREYWEMLYPKTSLPYKQLEDLIDGLILLDKKIDELKKADMGVNYIVGEGKLEVVDFRSNRKMEDIYLNIKKSILEQIIGVK